MKKTLEIKVGLFTIIGLILLLLWSVEYGRLRFGKERGYKFSIIFDDVGGLGKGSDVQVAGVKVGRVLDLYFTPDQKVKVIVKIDSTETLINRNAIITVESGLVGERWLSIMPNPEIKGYIKPGEELQGENPVALEDLIKYAKKNLQEISVTLGIVQKTLNNVNQIVGDPQIQMSLKTSVKNIQEASKKANELLGSVEMDMVDLSAQVKNTLKKVGTSLYALTDEVKNNFKEIGNNVYDLTEGLETIVKENQPDIRSLVENLKATSKELQEASEAINKLVGDAQISSDLRETLSTIRRTGLIVEDIATNLKEFITDKKLQNDLQETIANTKETLANANALLEGSRDFWARKSKLMPKNIDYEVLITGERLENKDKTDASIDLLAYLYGAEGGFIKTGITDVNEENKVDLQLGKTLSNQDRIRFGIIKAKFGLGYDRKLSPNFTINVDLFDVDDLKCDFMGRYKLNERIDLIMGVDNLFNTKEYKLGTGIKF